MFSRTFFYTCTYIWLNCYHYSVANSNRASITNSTGQYITSKLDRYDTDNIICKHALLCHIQVINPLQIKADADNVYMDLTRGRSVKVYSEANHLTIRLNGSSKAELYLQKNNNVNMHLINVGYSHIYAQYATNVNVLLSQFNRGNVFDLNFVSNQINFEFESSENKQNTIIATNANHFNLSIEDDSKFYGNVYCPYRSNNSCNFNIPTIWQIDGYHLYEKTNIYVSDMKLNTIHPLNIYFANQATSYYGYFTVWCQENKNSLIYESFTKIIKHGTECTNVTSECCYLKHLRENIFCPDDNCTVNCNQTDCVNKDIYSSGLTNTLNVICTNNNCYNTVIYCPFSPNSVCNVSCDTDEYACYRTTIKYNTNNYNVNNFNCIHRYSCQEMQIFVDDVNKTKNIFHYMNVRCIQSSSCRYLALIINTELKQLNIDCIGEYSCYDVQINGTLVQNMQIKCLNERACAYMTVYPKSDSINTISIYCDLYSCYGMRIISTVFQHTLDYLSLTDYSRSCQLIYSISEYTGEDSTFKPLFINNGSTNLCRCNLKGWYWWWFRRHSVTYEKKDDVITYAKDPDLFSCPLSNSYNNIIDCDGGEDCEIYLVEDVNGTMIYANNANTLFLSCKNSSFVQIFADHVTNLSMECLGRCEFIQLYGIFIETFELKCDDCFGLTIDVPHAKFIHINAYYMQYTEIYSINATYFYLECNEDCWLINFAISACTDISIHCKSKCENLLFYSENGLGDLNNVTVCDYTDFESWQFYCPSPVNVYSYFPDYCEWKSRLSRTFCKCQYQLNNTLEINHTPFAQGCRTINEASTYSLAQKIIGGMLCTIVFGTVLCWIIIGVKIFLLMMFDSKSWKELVLIEPPKKIILYYIHCSDLMIWMAQGYIVITCWYFFNYCKQDVCDAIQDESDIEDGEKVCSDLSICSWSQDKCVVDESIYILTMMMTVTLPVSIAFIFVIFICSDYSAELGNQVNVKFFSHFACMYCCLSTRTKIEEYFLKRDLFKYDWIMLAMITIRYLLFFIPVFIIYSSYIESNLFTIEWYDIFPILLMIFLNATIKQWYRMLSPYDETVHVKYIINEIFGKHCGSIIYMFLDENINEEKVTLI